MQIHSNALGADLSVKLVLAWSHPLTVAIYAGLLGHGIDEYVDGRPMKIGLGIKVDDS